MSTPLINRVQTIMNERYGKLPCTTARLGPRTFRELKREIESFSLETSFSRYPGESLVLYGMRVVLVPEPDDFLEIS